MSSLRHIFKRLYESGFKVNLEKFCFFQLEIKYLGHFIDSNGIRNDNEKVEGILEIRAPRYK